MINEYSTYFPHAIMLFGFILGYTYRWLSDRKAKKEIMKTVNELRDIINDRVHGVKINYNLPKPNMAKYDSIKTESEFHKGMRKV